jgi:hypothetical protein
MARRAKRDLTPEQRAKMAEMRERVLKFPFRQTEADQERLRLIGEKLGLTRLSEQIRRAKAEGKSLDLTRMSEQLLDPETEEPAPSREPTPKKPRKRGGGNKPSLSKQQIDAGKKTFRAMLEADPTWADNKTAAALKVIEILKLDVSPWTVQRWIVAPVLKRRAK